MSLRQQAKILGVNAGHLSRMINGKRPWNEDVKSRYEMLVGNTFGNTRDATNLELADRFAKVFQSPSRIAEVISSTLIPPTMIIVHA